MENQLEIITALNKGQTVDVFVCLKNFMQIETEDREEAIIEIQERLMELIEEAKTAEFNFLSNEDVLKDLQSIYNQLQAELEGKNQEVEEVKMSFTQRVINFFKKVFSFSWNMIKKPFVWVKSLFSKSEDKLEE